MRLIDSKVLADEILGEIFERGQASGLWEKQLEIGALTYADIEYAEGYDRALDDVYRRISDMKTIEAIPIDWIEDYCKFRIMSRPVEWFEAIQIMLDDWKKEEVR